MANFNSRMAQAIENVENFSAVSRERIANPDRERARIRGHVDQVCYDTIEPIAAAKAPHRDFLLLGPQTVDELEKRGIPLSYNRPIAEEKATTDNNADWDVKVGEQNIMIWELLGEEWTEHIEKLHSFSGKDIEQNKPERIANGSTCPKTWQWSGIEKLLYMAVETPFKGAILADEMGLGKTLATIITGEILQNRYGGINVVVCPKNCAVQWEEELVSNLHPAPKVKLLTEPHMTANQLLVDQYEWVIVGYEFMQSRFESLQAFERDMKELSPRSVAVAAESLTFGARKSRMARRPASALYSDVYELLGIPICCFVLDEVQVVKNTSGKTYKAVRAFKSRFKFCLTGTPFANLWSDVYSPVSLLPGHPFDTRARFMKAFANAGNHRERPVGSKEKRLIKFLQGLVISRPVSMLDLKGLKPTKRRFWIGAKDQVDVIVYLVQQFYEAMAKAGTQTFLPDASLWHEKAVYCITVAQLVATHPQMLRPAEESYIASIQQQAAACAQKFVDQFPDIKPGSTQYYAAVFGYMDKTWTQQKNATKKPSKRNKVTRRFPPNPEAARELAKTRGPRLRKQLAALNAQATQPLNQSPVEQAGEDVEMTDVSEPETSYATSPAREHDTDEDGDPSYVPGKDGSDEEDSESLGEYDTGTDDDDDSDNEGVTANRSLVKEPRTAKQRVSKQDAEENAKMKHATEGYCRTTTSTAEQDAWEKKLRNLTLSELKSARMTEVLDIITFIKVNRPGEKVLVFSKFRKALDILERVLNECELEGKVEVLRFDGTVDTDLRQTVKARFKHADASERATIMLVTAGCGGAGLNLASASHVVIMEPWWRKTDVDQAIGRAYRNGQENEVEVWYVEGLDSLVDRAVKKIQTNKAVVSDAIMEWLRRPDDQPPRIPLMFRY